MVKAEFILGLLGGIIGFFSAIAFVIFEALASLSGKIWLWGITIDASNTLILPILFWSSMIVSVVGIIGSVISEDRPKLGGELMLASGAIGLVTANISYVLPAILLIVGGILALKRKKAKR